jgi:translation initiation factor IF-2
VICFSLQAQVSLMSKILGLRRQGGPGDRQDGFRRRQQQERSKQDPTARRSSRAQRRMERAEARSAAAPVREEIFELGDEGMSVAEVALRLAVSTAEVVKTLFMQGIMVQVNQVRGVPSGFSSPQAAS